MDRMALTRDQFPIPAPPETFLVPAGMVRDEFPAMGTTVSLLTPEKQGPRASALVRQLFAEWEQTLSRFLPESELSRLNRLAGQPVIVSQLLFNVLQAAQAAAQASGGLYDPTLLNLLIDAGYDRSFEQLPAQQPAKPGRPFSPPPDEGWRQLHLEPALHRVTISANRGIDLGGIAKGMAVDAALARLRDLSIEAALVNAGGDLAVTGLPPGGTEWQIAIQSKAGYLVVPFQRGALATSSRARRQWQQGKQLRHHLLDPRTGEPAQSQLWSVTVAAGLCMQAEVAAKVAFILGPEQGQAFLTNQGVAGLLIENDGSWSAAGNWPTTLMRPLRG